MSFVDKANRTSDGGRHQGFALFDASFKRVFGSDSLIIDSVLLLFNKPSSRSISSRLMAASSKMMLARNERWRRTQHHVIMESP
jgi:hypothetical protein